MNFADVVEKKVEPEMKKRPFEIDKIRADFPILSREINGKPLVYLDNAATTQKPDIVIESIKHFYTYENANIHRGLHFLSELATGAYETARLKVKEYLNALSASEIIFTKGTTDGINLLATTFWRAGFLKEDDEIIITEMEHHANIVPWQLVGNGNKIKLKVGKPIKAMLAQKAKNIDDAFKKLGTPLAVEYKYDGFRLLIHKSEKNILLFTRRLENVKIGRAHV